MSLELLFQRDPLAHEFISLITTTDTACTPRKMKAMESARAGQQASWETGGVSVVTTTDNVNLLYSHFSSN
jgi:hypothetical protein